MAFIAAAFVFLGAGTAGAMDPGGPWFHVMVPGGHIGGGGWSPNQAVTVDVDTDAVEGAEYSAHVMSNESGWINADLPDWANAGIEFGDAVTVTDGTSTKTHTLIYVEIANYDAAADTVGGFAAFETTVQVEAHNNAMGQHATRLVNSGGDPGGWSANFQNPEPLFPQTIDIMRGTHLDAIAIDADGDGTQVGVNVPNPHIQAEAGLDVLQGWEWPPNASVDVTVQAPPAQDYVFTLPTNGQGFFYASMGELGTEAPDDITPGMTVTVAGGGSTRTITVTTVQCSGVALESDVVTGTAQQGTRVQVSIFNVPGYMPSREVTADATTGEWSADFGVVDPNNPNESDPARAPFDIVKGTSGQALQVDEDGDSTRSSWQILDTRFMVNSSEDRFMGSDWPAGQQVTIEIDDPPYDGVPEYTMWTGIDGGGSFNAGTWDGPRDPEGNNFDVQPGQHVTVTSGSTTKDTYVSALAVSGVDPDADTVTGDGAGEAGVVAGDIWNVPPGLSFRHDVTADETGAWVVDFGAEGEGENPFDVTWWTQGGVQQFDIDGDSTEVSWQTAVLSAAPNGDGIWGWGFYAPGQVTVQIDDPSNGEGVDETVFADHDATGSFNCNTNETGFDLLPGMQITASDGITTKVLTPIDFTVTSVAASIDTLYGEAPPDTTFQVYVQDWTEDGQPFRTVTSDSFGQWSADFGTANLDEFVYDIRPGTNGWLSHRDAESDESQFFWNVPNPFIGVNHVNNNIWGEDWAAGPGEQVIITVDDPDTGVGVDYTFTAPITEWNAGFRIDTTGLEESFDLVPGMVVDVVNGARHKDTIVGDVNVTEVDIDLETITGTAEPNRQVQVTGEPRDGQDSWPMRFVTADENGDWTVDFSVAVDGDGDEDDATGWGRTLDIVKGTSGQATQWEDPYDGDHSQADWHVPNPVFGVNRPDNNLWGSDFTGGSYVTIEVDDPQTQDAVDFSRTAPTENGEFWADFGEYTIDSGMTVTVSDGVDSKTHVVTAVSITDTDADSDTVTGTAVAGSAVQVFVSFWGDEGPPSRFVTADSNGVWSADFSTAVDDGDGEPNQGWGRTFDLQPASDGEAQQVDDDGDLTLARWWIPDPRITVNPRGASVGGWGWPASAHLLLAVDSLNGTDYYAEIDCDPSGGLEHPVPYDLQPGDIVTVTDGTHTRVLLVSDVAVTEVNAENETVSGTATPLSDVEVEVWNDEGSWRMTQADSNGVWSVDFSVPWDEQPAIDLSAGQDGEARELDADGDRTTVDWHIANPRAWADPVNDIACAEEFLPSVTVTLTVDDLTTPAEPDITVTQQSDDGGWAYFEHFGDVNPDCVVTLTDGLTLREIDVANVTVASIDIDAESMAGTADPNATVEIWMDDGYMGATAQANEFGEWSRVLGPPLDPVVLDLFPGLSGQVVQSEEDGDSTRVSWQIPNPKIEVSAVGDWLEGHDWDPGVEVLVTVDDPVGPDFITTATADPWRYIGLWDTGYDVKPGQLVTFTDGSRTATHTVTDLLITGWSEADDTVWGTAQPGTWVNVEIWSEDGIGRAAQADQNGDWSVDFTDAVGPEPWDEGFDIVKGTDGRARQYEPDSGGDGDATSVDFHVLNPRFTASPFENVVWGADWAPNVPMTVTVDATGTAPDAVYPTTSDEWGSFGFGEPGPPMGPVDAGDTITVTDGVTTKTHVVTSLAITSIDRHTGLITGVADTGITLVGWRHEVGGGEIGVGPDGSWTATFGDPGDPALPSGASGEFEQPDADSDATHAFWRIPFCETYADPVADRVYGSDWSTGVDVHVTVDDTTTLLSPDHETTVTAGPDGFDWSLEGIFDIKAGTVVTASDGDFLKEHIVTQLTVSGVDAVSDVITGTAEPGTRVWIRIPPEDGGMFEVQREVVADVNGSWTADLTDEAVGMPMPEGRAYDLKAGDTGTASQGDDDADFTSIAWTAAGLPEAFPDAYSVNEDTTLTVDAPGVLENDTYTSPNAEVVASVQHGTLALGTDGSLVYRPSPDFAGSDRFYYRIDEGAIDSNVTTVTITVNPVNDAPVASDHTTSTPEDTPKTVAVLAGLSDVDGGAPTLTGVTQAAHGHVAILGSAAVYTPVTNWSGTDSFTYTVSDGAGGTDTATVTVNVTAVNDAPVASDQTTSTPEDTAKSVAVLAGLTDVDGGAPTLTGVTQAAHGHVAILGNAALYTPVSNWNGTDSFTYTVSDGAGGIDSATVTVTVIPVNDAPAAQPESYSTPQDTTLTVAAPGVLANDTDVDNVSLTALADTQPTSGSLTLATNGSLVYVPMPGYSGTVSFTYHARDGVADSAPVAVSITVIAAGDRTPPVTTASGAPFGWSSSDVTVTLSATDTGGSGVASVHYWLGNAVPTPVLGATALVPVTVEGENVLSFRATDASGNVEATKTATVRVDKTPPTAPASLSYSSLTTSTVALTWPAATDALSGVAGYEVLDGTTVVATGTATAAQVSGLVPGSSHVFGVRALDAAGNRSSIRTLNVTVPEDSDSEEIPPGPSATVTLTVPATGPGGGAVIGTATVTMTDVTVGGTLTVVRSENPPSQPPANFKFVDDYFDIDFTGSFTGTLTITLPYDPRIPDSRAANLTLKHWKNNGWEAVPTTVDLVNHTITAELTSLSPVAIAEPDTAVATARLVPNAAVAFPAYGASASFTVRLLTSETVAQPLPGFTVTVDRAVGGTWSRFATATPVPGSPGVYRFSAKPYAGVRTVFRIRLAENGLYGASEKLIYVVPKAKVGRPVSSSAYPRAYRTFYVRGSVSPKQVTSGKVEVYKYSKSKRRYVRITTKSVRITSGAYRLSLKLAAGTYRFRTYVGANLSTSPVARTYSSYSGTVRVR